MKQSGKRIVGVLCAAGLGAALLTGCGGGGGKSALPQSRVLQPRGSPSRGTVVAAQSTQTTARNVSFAIRITPKRPTRAVGPNYISPSSGSLRILTDGSNPIVVQLTPQSPNCSPDTSLPGSYICTAKIGAVTGNHVFTITAYDATNGTGNILSTNSTGTVYVKPVGQTMISIVLEGAVRYVSLALATTNPPVGAAATIGLTGVLEDADRNVIIGPAPFEFPVTVTTSDPVNGALSKTTLKSPADGSTVRVQYSGAKIASITFSAAATGLPPGNVTATVLTPGTQHLYVANYAQSGTVRVFNLVNPAAVLPPISGDGMTYPQGAAIDASGKLYVANGLGPGRIAVFDTMHGNAVLPGIGYGNAGVALNASGKLLYTVSASGLTSTVNVFDTATGNQLATIADSNCLAAAWGVALDATGKLYVTNIYTNGAGICVYDTAHGNVPLPGIGGLSEGYGAVVDANGKLYVANYDAGPAGVGEVSVFDTLRGNAALPPITGGGINGPEGGVALDASGKLYVANNSGSVSVFDTTRGNAPLTVISGGGLTSASGLAVR